MTQYGSGGGIAGYLEGEVLGSYNTGDVTVATGGRCAGRTDRLLRLNDFYSAASQVSGGVIIGDIKAENNTITRPTYNYENCYYLSSGASQAIGSIAGDYATQKSAANMKKESFAKSLGNAFVYNEGGYPMLFWEAGIPMLSIDKTELSFNELNQQDTITPDTSYEGELLWTSSDDKIAAVDEDGVVTAVDNGTCTITVDAGGAKASCEVTVAYEYYLKETEITMKPDFSKELKVYSKSNDEPTTLEIKYTSSNEDVAEVNKRGVVSANAPGTAEIHAVIGGIDLICVVTVEGVKGDVNADGELTVADLVIFQKWLLADPDIKLNNWKAADLCTDNKLDVFDLVLMRRELINIKTK